MQKLLFFFLFVSASVVFNQHVNGQTYDFVVLDSESEIAGIRVNDITQDSNGYIWAATNLGVSRYDGVNFVNYNRKNGLGENYCTTIFCDEENRIWVGHQAAGVSIISADSVYVISEENGLANNEVHDIFQAANGAMWIATYGGVSTFDGNMWKKMNTTHGLASNNIQSISQDAQGRMWVGTFGAGINIIEKDKIQHLHNGHGLVNNYVMSLQAANQQMMIGTLGGLSLWENNTFRNTSAVDGLSNSQVNQVTASNNGDVWLATYSGLNRLRQQAVLSLTEINGLPNNEVLSVFVDAEQNTWFGTKKGLVRIQNLAFTHYLSTDDLDIDPSFIYRDSKGKLWAANEAGGVLTFDGNAFVNAFDDPDINNHQISAIAEDGEGNTWFGTMDFGGLFQFNGKRLFIYSDEFGLADNNINCLLQDAEGNLLIGTPNGLSKYDGSGFSVVFVSDNAESNHITAMELATDGTVYLGTASGNVFRLKDGHVDGEVALQAESAITDLAFGTLGLAIATQSDGLFLHKNGVAKAISGIHGLSTRAVSFNGNTLFVGSANGLQELSVANDSLVVKKHTREDGYMGGACKRGVMMMDKNTLWLGTTKGIVRFCPSEYVLAKQHPTLLLTDLQLFYNKVDWKTQGFDVANNGLPQALVLDYTQNSLQFYFRGIHHRQPSSIRFKWFLDGYESSWNPASSSAYVSYPNLPPGSYTFKLIACAGTDLCSTKPVEFSFEITPPFWKTKLFYILSVLGILLGGIVFVKMRERRLKEEKRVLEATVLERTKELRAQKEIVEGQNKHITESIEYAKNIQMAVLPSEEDMQAAFKDHFVFYRPKDTVGGDFYWVFSEGDTSWAAAIDCTGHGVAGAFMSMIGTDLLNQIIIEQKVDNPAQVLSEMDKGIKLAFAQSAKEFESDQGMDVALIRIDRKNKELVFAGAQRPLYLMQDGELIQIDGNKLSISCTEQRREEKFRNHTHHIKGNTTAYLFSDGIVDQFGGPRGKKFMIRRVRQFLQENHALTIAEQAVALSQTFDEWKGAEQEQIDDVMFLGIRL